MSTNDKNKPTTGHEWDGIQEFDNPLPRWWLWTFYVTVIWGIAYTVVYPAWPYLGSDGNASEGLWNYSSRADVSQDIQRYKDANAAVDSKMASVELSDIAGDADLMNYAMNGGAAVYKTWCAQCHGAGASGAVGFPNLIDDDWLWGGTIEDIHTTISHGIRNETDDDARYSEMPKFGEILEPAEIGQLAQYVLALSGQDHDATAAAAATELFADNCAACHAEDGTGDHEQGAPNLTDAIWLYGGDAASITATITNARFGVMPAWAGRLSESQIRQVATWVHQQGGGE
jgi:cytochrome c oxidase cbb3-type subunit 3